MVVEKIRIEAMRAKAARQRSEECERAVQDAVIEFLYAQNLSLRELALGLGYGAPYIHDVLNRRRKVSSNLLQKVLDLEVQQGKAAA